MDREAWRAAVHGVSKSWTWLSNWTELNWLNEEIFTVALIFISSWCIFKFIFNWRIITLQSCVGFCHTTTWISKKYTYVCSFLNLPPTPNSTATLSVFTGHQVELPVLHKFPPASCFTYGDVYFSQCSSLTSSYPDGPLESISVFSMLASLFLPCK